MSALTTSERRDLETLEGVVQRHLAAFIEVGRALVEIRDRRLYRATHRTFEEYCHERWLLSRTRAYRLMDGAAVAGLVSPNGDIPAPANEAQARELVPLLRDDEQQVVEVWRELRAEYGDDVTAARIKRVVRGRLERVRRERIAELPPPPTTALPADVDVRCSDLRDLHLEPGSVDLIFTDPPYLQDTLGEYDALAEFAARALRPGAMLVAYTGNVHALDCMQRLARHLTFVAPGGVVMPGSHTLLHGLRMRVTLKPLVFFSRGPCRPRGWWTNVISSPRPDKQHHPWQQSEGDSEDLIAALTEPGDLVCDPFLGSGTTAAVAHRLGRRFVGCDIDPNAVAVARQRLAGELEAGSVLARREHEQLGPFDRGAA